MTWAFAGFSQEPFFEFKDHQKKSWNSQDGMRFPNALQNQLFFHENFSVFPGQRVEYLRRFLSICEFNLARVILGKFVFDSVWDWIMRVK